MLLVVLFHVGVVGVVGAGAVAVAGGGADAVPLTACRCLAEWLPPRSSEKGRQSRNNSMVDDQVCLQPKR